MAITFSLDQIVSQGVSNEAPIKLLVKKGIFTREEFLEMLKVVDREMKRGWLSIVLKGFEE